MKNKYKDKKKTKWQVQREKDVSKGSHFDPEIHQLGREGYGYQMKRGLQVHARGTVRQEPTFHVKHGQGRMNSRQDHRNGGQS